MGFDIYGENPEFETKKPTIDWESNPSEKESKKFFKQMEKFEEENPGYYFRNNVWYWRPLWFFVCNEIAPKILSSDDLEKGMYNDGHVISAIKANHIADKIKEFDKSGELNAFAEEFEETRNSLPKVLCEVCSGKGFLNNESYQGKCKGCDGEGKDYPIQKQYPLCADNIRDFGKFCRHSGGFAIW